MAKKYYAVAVGRNSGIFTSWESARQEVAGFSGARFKSFPSISEAEAWLENPVYQPKTKKKRQNSGRTIEKKAVQLPENAIIVYTDGGCINNPGPGGYGVVIEKDGIFRELVGGEPQTTNNRMEIMAAIVALRELVYEDRPIVLFSDSSYLVNGICKGWAKSWRKRGWLKSDGISAKNSDLWEELLDLLEFCTVDFRWVKGHAGNPMNERCDQLAAQAAKEIGGLL